MRDKVCACKYNTPNRHWRLPLVALSVYHPVVRALIRIPAQTGWHAHWVIQRVATSNRLHTACVCLFVCVGAACACLEMASSPHIQPPQPGE